MKSIVLIGDSIRLGYQETVRGQLADWANVWAPVENGGTTENVLVHLDEWAISRRADVVHINCGLHDIKKEFNQDTAAVPLSAYTENVRSILTRLQAETEAAVVWALTTPVNQERHRKNKAFDRFETDVVTYNGAASQISQELGLTVNDLYSVVASAGTDNILLADGVHFRPEGYALLGESVAKCIKRATGIAAQDDAADR
jgi:lysophospholipase L1-like esterase